MLLLLLHWHCVAWMTLETADQNEARDPVKDNYYNFVSQQFFKSNGCFSVSYSSDTRKFKRGIERERERQRETDRQTDRESACVCVCVCVFEK